MQDIPIPTGAALPTNLRAIVDGDSLNTANHQVAAERIADALGYLADQAVGPNADGGTLPQMNYVILPGEVTKGRTHFKVPALLGNYEYTLPTGAEGQSVVFRMNPNAPNTATIKRPDTTTIAIMDGDFGGTVCQQYVEVTKLTGVWVVTGFGNSDENHVLT